MGKYMLTCTDDLSGCFIIGSENLQRLLDDVTVGLPAVDRVRNEPNPDVANRLTRWRIQINPGTNLNDANR